MGLNVCPKDLADHMNWVCPLVINTNSTLLYILANSPLIMKVLPISFTPKKFILLRIGSTSVENQSAFTLNRLIFNYIIFN